MRSKGLPIAIGCFLGVILITAYEAASSHAGYTWTTETDSAWGEIQKIRIRDGRWRLAVDFRGEIEMTPVEDGIANLGPGAFLEIEERREGVRRRLEATPGPGGRPKLAWFVDGEATPPGEESREWLARVLPRVYRVTGIDAEGRVGRLLAAGGIAGVLAEIDKIGSDRVQRIYFEKLLQKAEPAAADLERVLRGMERAIGSDHEMGRLMRMIPAERLTLESTADAFVAATRTIGSDFELRRALTPLLQAPVFPEISESMLDATTGIGSDFELARLLIGVIEAYPLDRPLPAGFTRALRTVASDHEQRKVLKAALRRSGPGGVELDALLETAALGIGSDFELAAVMVGFTESHQGDLPESFFHGLRTIGSDSELRRVLSAATSRSELSAENMVSLLESARGISSDHEMSRLLRQLAEAHPIGDEAWPAFDRAMASIGSDHERQRVVVTTGR